MGLFLLVAGLIFLLILLGGFFAGSEIALISARRSRINQLAEGGDTQARRVQQLQGDPIRFLATVQVGVTVVGALASALAGVVAIKALAPFLATMPLLAPVSEVLALAIMVIAVSFLALTVGELIPKSLALRWAEPIARWVARPVDVLCGVLTPITRILTATSSLILRPFGGRVTVQPGPFTEEDIKLLLREGRAQGIFDQTEQELIHSVFEFTDISVREVMVPRGKISGLPATLSFEEVLNFVAKDRYSRYPVYQDNLEDVIGILHYRDVLAASRTDPPTTLRSILHPAYFVPETMKVSHLLKELQRRRLQMSLIVNEYGGLEGLVTMEDLIEEIVGEIRGEYEAEEKRVEHLQDGSLVIDASLSVRDLHDYGVHLDESSDFETLAGFVLVHLQGLPRGGEIITFKNWKCTVVDMDGRRIAKVKMERLTPQAAPEPLPAERTSA